MTEAGQALLPKLTEGLDMLTAAVAALRSSDKAGPLTISVALSFAAKWLVPNAESFRAAHPDIGLRISSNIAIIDFRADEVNVAIRFRHGHYPGFKVDKLFSDALAPLCSPSLLDGQHLSRGPRPTYYTTPCCTMIRPIRWGLLWTGACGCGSMDAEIFPRTGVHVSAVRTMRCRQRSTGRAG